MQARYLITYNNLYDMEHGNVNGIKKNQRKFKFNVKCDCI